jgi:hypothetical protein
MTSRCRSVRIFDPIRQPVMSLRSPPSSGSCGPLCLLAKLLPLVEEYREKLDKLTAEQGGRLTLEKGMTRRSSGGR